jgi:signal transduction histidine kinase
MLSETAPFPSTTKTGPVHPEPEHKGYEGNIAENGNAKAAKEALRRLSGRLLQIQDEERRRIARELHDSVGQSLAVIEMNLVRALDFS